MGPRASYRAVVAECAPIIGQCAPARVAISTQCAPATCVVIAPSQLAYRAATSRHAAKHGGHKSRKGGEGDQHVQSPLQRRQREKSYRWQCSYRLYTFCQ